MQNTMGDTNPFEVSHMNFKGLVQSSSKKKMKIAGKRNSFIPKMNQRHHSTHASPMNLVNKNNKEATHQEILNYFTYNNISKPGATIQVNEKARNHANSVLLTHDNRALEQEKNVIKDKWIMNVDDSKLTNYDKFMTNDKN